MFGGMNPKKMEQMMRKMGISQQSLDAKKVIIELGDKRIVFLNPDVTRVNMSGQDTFQIIGNPVEEDIVSADVISDEDIQTVVDQCNCSSDDARKALQDNDGDIAKAILDLSQE